MGHPLLDVAEPCFRVARDDPKRCHESLLGRLDHQDRFAPELQNSEITMPAGAGDVPLVNIKMIAALAVMKKAIEKADMEAFIKKHGTVDYTHTQGHIPAGVPFIGPACEGIRAGKMKRVMITTQIGRASCRERV